MSFSIYDEFDIPEGWKPIKLKELADFNKEAWKKTNQPEHIHYIDIKSVSTGTMEKPTYMSFSEAPSRARRIVNDGDIIISTVRPNLKQFTIIENRNETNLTASTGFCTIRAKDEKFKWFIYAIITSDFFTRYLERTAEGAAYPAFKPIDISESTVALPPEDELETISSIVKSLYRKKAVNNSMSATLEKIAQRIFKSWFVDFDPVKANAEGVPFDGLSPEIQALFPNEFEESEFGMIPKGWEAKTFKDFCKSVSTGGTPKRSESSYWNGNVHWLSSGEVKKPISIETKEYITELGLQKSAAKLWPVETVVIAMYGATAGEVTILANEMTTNQACCGLIPNDNSSFYLFIAATLEKEKLASKASGAAQQNLNKGIIETHQFIMPNNSLLEQFDKTVRPLFNKWILNEQQNLGLSKIRDKLLPRLISGKITIQKAEELLEEAS
ncbi:MAG: type I restriction enzyme S subunit [Enterobacterales bacterium]|jgi:type I restriction enzyme S subunit